MSDIDYKKKAFKYKLKYLELKNKLDKINGGVTVDKPYWYHKFQSELINIYQMVQNYYTTTTKPILTGSGAIAYLLNYLDMNEDLASLSTIGINPHDLDFLYLSKTGLPNPNRIGNFYIDPLQKTETSVTYNFKNPINYIESFDVTRIDSIKYFELNHINIINLNHLSSFYTSDFLDEEDKIKKDTLKKNLVKKIIEKIKSENREEEFGLARTTATGEIKKKSSNLFGDESDNEI